MGCALQGRDFNIPRGRIDLQIIFFSREGHAPSLFMCAEHVRQLEGESPFGNLMEVKS
jgi:hypothetical protein